MNERIKELADQAKFMAEEITNKKISKNTELDAFTEQFAELIIKECVMLMKSERDMYANPGTYGSREYYERMDAKYDAFDDAVGAIRYHFGIK